MHENRLPLEQMRLLPDSAPRQKESAVFVSLSPVDLLPESAHGDGEEFMVRSRCHIISQSQLWEFFLFLAQRRHEINMSNGRDSRISSIFKCFFPRPPLHTSLKGANDLYITSCSKRLQASKIDIYLWLF